MIEANQLHDLVVKPALLSLGKQFSQRAARTLIMGTIAHESMSGRFIKQVGGPALGIIQMEPVTHDDIWENYLRYKPELVNRLKLLFEINDPNADRLIYDLRYNVVMCRLHYRRVKEKLPAADDIQGLARYWKEHYNTVKGKGSTEQFIQHFNHYIAGVL